MDGMTEVRKSPSGRGRNYTPLEKKWCNCALPGASCGQQMISVDFQSAPIITEEAAMSPLRFDRCRDNVHWTLCIPALAAASYPCLCAG